MANDRPDSPTTNFDQSARQRLSEEAGAELAKPRAGDKDTTPGAVLLPGDKGTAAPPSADSPASGAPVIDRPADHTGPSDVLTQSMFDKIWPSVVQVDKGAPGALAHDGTGFYVQAQNGEIMIATNAHIASPDSFRQGKDGQIEFADPGKALPTQHEIVTASGERYPVTVYSIDPVHDVALLRFTGEPPKDAQPLAISTEPMKPGDPAWTVGHPHSDPRLHIAPGTLTEVTTALELDRRAVADFRDPPVPGLQACTQSALPTYVGQGSRNTQADRQAYAVRTALVSDMATAPGNSGSPEVDAQGEVIGMQYESTDRPQQTFVLASRFLTDLIDRPPQGTFQYVPDPQRPGHMSLNGITDASGRPILGAMDAKSHFLEACQNKGSDENQANGPRSSKSK